MVDRRFAGSEGRVTVVSIVEPSSIVISIESLPAHLPVVRAAVEVMARLIGFADAVADGVVMAVDEALANVIRHAYRNQAGMPIRVTLTALADQGAQTGMEIVLEDRGECVSPESIRPRDLDDVRPGGLGTHIMDACMDRVEYTPLPQGTRLTMVKYLATVPAGHHRPAGG